MGIMIETPSKMNQSVLTFLGAKHPTGHHKEIWKITLKMTSKTLPSKRISRKVGPKNGNSKIQDLLAKKF